MKKVYLIAAVIAVLAGFLLYRYMQNLEDRYREDYVPVAVAAVKIEENTQLTADMIKMVDIPSEGIHPSAVFSRESVIGSIASQTIYEEEQILQTKIKKTTEHNGKMSYSVPEGMRAITISVDTVSGVSGFLRTADRVDVILVTLKEAGDRQIETAVLLLNNLEILAVGTDPDSRKESYAPAEPAGVITLLVTPDEAVKLSLAASVGRLTTVLRSPADQEKVGLVPVEKQHLLH